MKIKEYIAPVLASIVICVLIGIFAYQCESERTILLKQERMIPIKPFYIIGKESGSTDYTIYCIDSNSNRFSFDVEFFNEENFQVGDTIK